MPAQSTSSGQNTGLMVIVVGIFMVIMAFLAVTYLTSDTIRQNQDKNSQRSVNERADLTQVTCGLWSSVGDKKSIDAALMKKIEAICKDPS